MFIIKSYLDLTHKFLSINYNLPYCIENTPFISLNDYIASISFDTDEVKCFYPPVGKIPKECIDFSYARNCSKFSCRALFKLPADRQLIVYCGQAFLVALPALVFDFTVIDEVLIPKRSFVYSELMILTVALATLSTSDF